MPKFCANLTSLFTELPFLERFAAAREAGFDAVEVLFPYDSNVQDIVNELSRHSLTMALINCPPPNYAGGDPGWAAVPALQDRFRRDFKRALRYAKALGAQHLHIMAGDAQGPQAKAVFIDNLRWAAAEAPKQSLTIEPVSPRVMPEYFLNDYDLARDVIADVGAPNLRLQFDAFHAAHMTGDMLSCWDRVADLVVHVQVAQTPDRSEPGKGQIDYPAFFARLDRDGYAGWVSGEYTPAASTTAGLGWLGQPA